MIRTVSRLCAGFGAMTLIMMGVGAHPSAAADAAQTTVKCSVGSGSQLVSVRASVGATVEIAYSGCNWMYTPQDSTLVTQGLATTNGVDYPLPGSGIVTFTVEPTKTTGGTVASFSPNGPVTTDHTTVVLDFAPSGADAAAPSAKPGTCGIAQAPFPTTAGGRPPSLSAGKVTVGRTLTVDPGVYDPGPVSFTYQWYRDHKGKSYAIRGATRKSYVVTKYDMPYGLYAKVTVWSPACRRTASATVTARVQPVSGYTHPTPPGKPAFRTDGR